MIDRIMSRAFQISALACCIRVAGAQTPSATTPIPPPQVLFPVGTAPSNGDQNPYGIAFVPFQVPVGGTSGLNTNFNPGDILISNFNNGQNAQGTGNLQGLGTTITRIQSTGLTSTFYQTTTAMAQSTGQPGVGLTNALVCLQNGMVIVGSLPTTDGTFATASAGSLLFIRRDGALSTSIIYQPSATGGVLRQTSLGFVNNAFFLNANVINGPWSLAVNDLGNSAQLFLSNVLTGTVVRFHVTFDSDGNGVVFDETPIYLTTGLNHENDANGFLLGPSGLAYDPLPSSPTQDTLFIASSKDNAVYMIQGAGWNQGPTAPQLLVLDTAHLRGPLGVALAPNGNLYVANSDGNNADQNVPSKNPSEIELYDSVAGTYLGQFSVDPNNGGAFAVAFQSLTSITRPGRRANTVTPVARFAAVNDNQVVLNLWTLFFN